MTTKKEMNTEIMERVINREIRQRVQSFFTVDLIDLYTCGTIEQARAKLIMILKAEE